MPQKYETIADPIAELNKLMYPLSNRMRRQMEFSLKDRDAPVALHMWNCFPVDGPEIYDLCLRKNIPFTLEEISFSCAEEAVVYVCATQIERDDLSIQFRRYLLGKLIGAEMELEKHNRRRVKGIGMVPPCYFTRYTNRSVDTQLRPSGGEWAVFRISQAYNVTVPTIRRYKRFAITVDVLREKNEDMANIILSGICHMSYNEILNLSKQTPTEIETFKNNWEKNYKPSSSVKAPRHKKREEPGNGDDSRDEKNIKDMPAFDPDAEAKALIFTIPSWCGSLDRFLKKSNSAAISPRARESLLNAIDLLQEKTLEIQIEMEE